MLLCLMVVVLGLLVLVPDAPVARTLHQLLVEAPARRLARVTPGRVAFWVGLGLAGLILFGLFETEGVRLFAFMAPDIVVWFGMFDVAVFLDVFLIAAAMIATTRFRALKDQCVMAVHHAWRAVFKSFSRRRSRRPRSIRQAKPGRDDPDPVWSNIAYAG